MNWTYDDVQNLSYEVYAVLVEELAAEQKQQPEPNESF
jgi:hypothetical protein